MGKLFVHSWDIRSSAILHSADRLLVNDVSEQPIGPCLQGKAVEDETTVSSYQSTLRNIQEERRSDLDRGGSLRSWIEFFVNSIICSKL